MDIKVYTAENGDYVERVGCGYTVHTLIGDYKGECFCLEDAKQLAKQDNDKLYLMWDFLEDKPATGLKVYSYRTLAEARFAKGSLDLEASDGPLGAYIRDWVDYIDSSLVSDKLVKHFGA